MAERLANSSPLRKKTSRLEKIRNFQYSLRFRLVYIAGGILLAGSVLTLTSIAVSLQKSANDQANQFLETAADKIQQQLRVSTQQLTLTSAYLSSSPTVIQAVSSQNELQIREAVHGVSIKLRKSSGVRLPAMRVFLPKKVLTQSITMNPVFTASRSDFSVIKQSHNTHFASSGLQVFSDGVYLSSAVPIFDQSPIRGAFETSLDLKSVLNEAGLSSSIGVSVFVPASSEHLSSTDFISQNNNYLVLKYGNLAITGTQEEPSLFQTKTLPFYDIHGQQLGQFQLFYDCTTVFAQAKSMILLMSLFTIVGVGLLSTIMFRNATRVLAFLDQLKRVLIASHSTHFSEKFPRASVQCAQILKCTNTSCISYNDSTRVCYLETGDEAISPTYQNTCTFLQEYISCSECPVYHRFHGDELEEMQNIVNTTTRFWSDFLGSVGALLSDVFRSDTRSLPSLDGVSKYLEQLASLTSFGHAIQGVYNENEVYTQLRWEFQSQFNLKYFSLLQVDADEKKLRVVLHSNEDAELSGTNELIHRSVLADCELCRCLRVSEDVSSLMNPFICPYFGIDSTKAVRYCMPMVMGGSVGAVFTFVVRKEEWPQVAPNLSIMQKYLDETAPILSSLRLLQISTEQSLKDPLTKCRNRRFMDEFLVKTEAITPPPQLGFIMADLDHFKSINDRYGHPAGDELLRQVSATLQSILSKDDVLIRYGGEEFLIILVNFTDDSHVSKIAEELRLAVESTSLSLPNGISISKTLSLGTAQFPHDGTDAYQVIKCADNALYQAKEQGRNRVVQYVELS